MRKLKPEAQLVELLVKTAPLLHCQYIVIPDMIPTRDRIRANMPEHRKPFDGVLVTFKGCYAIECKANYNKQMPHQERIEKAMNSVCYSAYYVVKMIVNKTRAKYQIIQEATVHFETDRIEEVLRWFMKV